MSAPERLERLARHLLTDLDAVDSTYQERAASDAQKLQLIADAFEEVGKLALDAVCEQSAAVAEYARTHHDRPQKEST